MPAAPLVVLALLLQLAFALLPGDGWVVCLGGGTARAEDHVHAHDGSCPCQRGEHAAARDEGAPVHRPADPEGGDCDGVHLQRADGEQRQAEAPEVPAPARVALPCTLAALSADGPLRADRERAACGRVTPRGSPPPRTALVELGTVRIQR